MADGGGQTRIEFKEHDPKKWRMCARRGCGVWLKRIRKSHEKRGQGRYCSRSCKSIEWWGQRTTKERRDSRTSPRDQGHGRPENEEHEACETLNDTTPEPELRTIAGGRRIWMHSGKSST